MQVEERIGARIDVVGDEGRDLRRDRAAGVAREGAVEVEAVDRRDALAGHDRVDVVCRHQDEPALDAAGIELADQLADRDLPFVFVAVIAGFEHHGRPAAVRDHGERDARHAPGVVVRRVRDHQEPDLLPGAVEVDGGEGRGRPHGGGLSHRPQIGADHSAGSRSAAASAFAAASSRRSPLSRLAAPASPTTPFGERVPSWRQR